MTDAMILVLALRDPKSTTSLDWDGWTALLTIARAERLVGTLSKRLHDIALPKAVAAIVADELTNAAYQRRSALWEAECALLAMAHYKSKILLMKGTAYAAAELAAGEGRHIGDLDIMVARSDLAQVEAMLLAAGWEWVKEDAYDDAYYRDHMHELPPLIHKERDRMIDVHHTVLPLTARPLPDAAVMLADAIPATDGLHIMSPVDMVCHCAAHLIADGDLSGGLRNLWDMHCLIEEFRTADTGFHGVLKARAIHHQLWPAVHRAARLAHLLYGTQIPPEWHRRNWYDYWFILRLTARNQWGQPNRKFIRFAFYVRSHLLRMPPRLLIRHLWTKWSKR